MAMIVSIEGNIATGKSTILEYIKSLNIPNIYFVDEPVTEWLNVKDDNGMNALDCFYKDQKKNSFCFQVLAYITRLKKLIDAINDHPNSVIITERCIETDKYVFAKMLYEVGNISSIEWVTYNYWYDTFSKISKVDTIIYISTTPLECAQRIKKRNRVEENLIPLEYLEQCHIKHEEWLESTTANLIKINGNDMLDIIKENIKNIIYNLVTRGSESIITTL